MVRLNQVAARQVMGVQVQPLEVRSLQVLLEEQAKEHQLEVSCQQGLVKVQPSPLLLVVAFLLREVPILLSTLPVILLKMLQVVPAVLWVLGASWPKEVLQLVPAALLGVLLALLNLKMLFLQVLRWVLQHRVMAMVLLVLMAGVLVLAVVLRQGLRS
jgi:hypothetical protein